MSSASRATSARSSRVASTVLCPSPGSPKVTANVARSASPDACRSSRPRTSGRDTPSTTSARSRSRLRARSRLQHGEPAPRPGAARRGHRGRRAGSRHVRARAARRADGWRTRARTPTSPAITPIATSSPTRLRTGLRAARHRRTSTIAPARGITRARTPPDPSSSARRVLDPGRRQRRRPGPGCPRAPPRPPWPHSTSRMAPSARLSRRPRRATSSSSGTGPSRSR